MPDLVIGVDQRAATSPPCDASKRLATNSNSAIASRLYFGWPKPPVWFWVTRRPSTFNWNAPTPMPGSSLTTAFERAAGHEQRQVDEVPAVDRQVGHLPRIDVARDGGAGAFERAAREALTVTFSLQRRRHQAQVDGRLLADQDLDAGAGQCGEALERGGQPVGSDPDRQPEAAARSR